MSVHIGQNTANSQSVFVSTDISQVPGIHRAGTDPQLVSGVQLHPCTKKETVKPHRSRSRQENSPVLNSEFPSQNARQNFVINSLNSVTQSQSETYHQSSDSQDDSSNVSGTSALPSAPVHLQETVDNLLAAPAIGSYKQGVVHEVVRQASSPKNQLCGSIYKLPNSQVQQKPSMMRQFNDMPMNMQNNMEMGNQFIQHVCKCLSPNEHNVSQTVNYCPRRIQPQSHERPSISPHGRYHSQTPESNNFPNQDNIPRHYSLMHQEDVRKSPQPPNSVVYSNSPAVHVMAPQGQSPCYVPVNHPYGSQQMLMMQLDYQRRQIHQDACQSSQKPSNQVNVNQPVMYEDESWEPIHSQRVGPVPQNETKHSKTSIYQTFKKRRRRTSQKELEILENHFKINSLPSYAQREQLARDTGMTPRSVQVWFQNKRQSLKKKNMSGNQDRLYDSQYYFQASRATPNPYPGRRDAQAIDNSVDKQVRMESKKLQSPPPDSKSQIGQTHSRIPQGTNDQLSGMYYSVNNCSSNNDTGENIEFPINSQIKMASTPHSSENFYELNQQKAVNFNSSNHKFVSPTISQKDMSEDVKVCVPQENAGANFSELEYPQHHIAKKQLRTNEPEDYSLYSVPNSVQQSRMDAQDCGGIFSQARDPMATLTALAAMTSEHVDNY